MPDPDDRSWIVPGAEVVVYSTGSNPGPRRSTVLKVASQSFTVAGTHEPLRIQLDTLASKRMGGTWERWYYMVAHPDSEKARELAERERIRRLRSAAHSAAEEWRAGGGSKDPAKVDAVIAAFTAYRETLLPTDSTGATS